MQVKKKNTNYAALLFMMDDRAFLFGSIWCEGGDVLFWLCLLTRAKLRFPFKRKEKNTKFRPCCLLNRIIGL